MKKIFKTLIISLIVGILGVSALASPQQHHRLYTAMSGVVSFIYSSISTWIQTTPGTQQWQTGSNWQSNSIPILPPTTNSSITFFPSTNTSLIGSMNIIGDPTNITFNKINFNGTASGITCTTSVGTAGNTWTIDGSSPTISNNVYGVNNATNGIIINPNLVLNQNTTIVGSGTCSNGLTLNGTISGIGILTKSSTAELNINSNNYSAGLTMSAGLTVYNSPFAAPTGTVTFTGSPTFDNQLSSASTWSNNPPIFLLSASPTYNGTYSVNTGTNTFTFNSSRAVFMNGTASTVWRHGGPVIGPGFSATKSGTGTLDFRGSNGLASILLNNGIYCFSGPFSCPTGNVTFNGSSFDNQFGSLVVLTNNPTFIIQANVAFVGTNPLNLGTNTVTLTANRILTCSGPGDLYIAGPIIGQSYMFTHNGTGSLHLAGNNSQLGTYAQGAISIIYIDSNTAMPTNILWSNAGTFDTILTGVTNTLNPTFLQSGVTPTWANTPGGLIDWGTGTTTVSGAVRNWAVNNGIVRFRGAITGSTGLNKTGSGTMDLYGPTTIPTIGLNAGQLNFNSGSSIPSNVNLNTTGVIIDNTSGAAISNSTTTTFTFAQNAIFLCSSFIDWGGGFWNLASKAPDVRGKGMAIRGGYSSNASITKPSTSTGSLILSGISTNLFGWIIQGGTIYMNGDQTNTCTNTVGSVGSGGTLAGIGTIRGYSIFANSGQLQAGDTNGYGNLTCYGTSNSGTNGGISISSNGSNTVNVLNGTTYSSITMQSGNFNITGGPRLVINDTGASMSVSTVLTIVSCQGTSISTGTFNGQIQGSTVVGQTYSYTISYTGGTGHDITLTRQ